jgi:hypothetical protein
MTPPDHLDDETLSAALDGDEQAAAAHLAACAACRERLDALRRAAAAVGAPVPPVPTLVRERHIAAALAEAGTAAPARHRRRLVALAAAAALAAGVALPLALRDANPPDDLASRAAQAQKAPAERAQAETAPAAGAAALVDLGPLDEASLPAAVSARLHRAAAGAAPSEGGAAALAAPPLAPGDAERCAAAVRAATPGLAPLALAAGATWKGSPALVLAFSAGTGPVTVYVTDPACGILHFARLP